MQRYINVKKAIEAINDLPNCPNGHSDTYDKACIIGILEEVPTDDVVEVVRCKDCRHHEEEELGMVYCCMNAMIVGGWVPEDWFCADGERGEDG